MQKTAFLYIVAGLLTLPSCSLFRPVYPEYDEKPDYDTYNAPPPTPANKPKKEAHPSVIPTEAPIFVTKPATRSSLKAVEEAYQYLGTPYVFGGTTASGLDCSGLVFLAYQAADIKLPRISWQMAEATTAIPLESIRIGDLLFFATTDDLSRISHVGLVSKVVSNDIFFVHASSSRGVVEQSLMTSNYYRTRFLKATRPQP